MIPIILASQSPRRKELLEMLEYPFIIKTKSVEETYDPHQLPHDTVQHLSKIKAAAISKEHPDHLVIGADTIVVYANQILGKPKDRTDAYRMLKQLSNKQHHVLTGVTLCYQNKMESFYRETKVTFYPLTEQEIENYLNTDEPYDKAGAYAVQGKAAKFIQSLDGDFYNVVGLPIGELYQRLKNYITK